jgi:hypothetical protein
MSESDRSTEPIEILRDVNFAVLRQPTLEDICNDEAWWLPYRGYSGDYFGSSFEDAERSLKWERAVISRLPERTEEAEDQLLSELDDDEIAVHLDLLDLGVAAAVLALSAAGCATLVSCSGHFGEGRWSNYPMIQFATDEPHARILLELAEAADCGMAASEQGLLEVWARGIEPILHFAELIISSSQRFAELTTPFAESEDSDDTPTVVEVHPDQGTLFEE